MSADRLAEYAAFLTAAGWDGARRQPLAGDASARRYDRVTKAEGSQRAVLMDAPVGTGEEIQPFLGIARFLRDCGFSAPRIYHEDEDTGLILMEDLGDDLYARLCSRDPASETLIYGAAVDLLASLHRFQPPAGLPPYSAAVYADEAKLMVDWYHPAATGKKLSPKHQAEYLKLVSSTTTRFAPDRSVCVLRDYHAENLLWLEDRCGLARVGLLDFQDALLGHPAYDLVSLLEDARRDTSPELRQMMQDRYIRLSQVDRKEFLAAYAALGAQRNLKIIGIFTRLCQRDGKAQYLDMIPRVWAHLANDLRHPCLAELSLFVSLHFQVPTPAILARIRQGRA